MKSVICALVAALVLFVPATGRSQQEQSDQAPQAFRSAVDLVTIQASVRDKRGRPMTGLTTDDFEVRDNGQIRPVLSLRADLQSPLSVAILVDMSGSMRISSKTAMARRAFAAVLNQLHAGEDEVAVFAFDSRLHERHGFTTDLASVKDALTDFEPFGSTSLYDATAETARNVAARSATHKAVIVLTDGIDTSSTQTASEVSGLASSIDVPVFIVATIPSVDQRSAMEASERSTRADAVDLRDLAEWTGGQFVFASTFTETVVAASSLVGQLRQQYVLAIEAAAAHEWRRLDVRVKHPAASVKARSGYFGG
jgi:Ca-activated chloride channel family protein